MRLVPERERMIRAVLKTTLTWHQRFGTELISPDIAAALARLPREQFVDQQLDVDPYDDEPARIPCGQRLSAPSIVALMTQMLHVEPSHRVLELGTGSGYQASVLAQLVREVVTVEILEPLAEAAGKRLRQLGFHNVVVLAGDGRLAADRWAPFDRILVTACLKARPDALLGQLREGGRLLTPLFHPDPPPRQRLFAFDKLLGTVIESTEVMPVQFFPVLDHPDERFISFDQV